MPNNYTKLLVCLYFINTHSSLLFLAKQNNFDDIGFIAWLHNFDILKFILIGVEPQAPTPVEYWAIPAVAHPAAPRGCQSPRRQRMQQLMRLDAVRST